MQAQLAAYYSDAIKNSIVREDTARSAPALLVDAFATAGKSLRLYNRLVALQERTQGKELLGERRKESAETLPVTNQVLIRGTTLMKGAREKHLPTQDDRGVGVWAVGSPSEGVSLESVCITRRKKTLEGPGKRMEATPKEVGVVQNYTLFGLGNEVTSKVQVVGRKI